MGGAAKLACVAIALATLPALRLATQEPLLTPGTRVRIAAPSVAPAQLIGTVRASDKDTLVVDVADRMSPVIIPVASVETIELSRGRHAHTWQGVGVGFLVGGVVGAALGASCEGDFLCPGPAGGALVLGVVAMLPGALVGALIRTERWEGVGPGGVSVGPGPTGLAVGVALRF